MPITQYSGGTLSVTVSLTGLVAYDGYNFTLVVYAAGNSDGQSVTLSMAGEAGGNSGSDLTTSATTRQISQGIGNAYNTFTGTVTSGTLTFTANLNSGQSIDCVNGFQLLLSTP